MHVHLPEQRSVAVEREVRECGYQKVLTENEFLNRPSLVGCVVNDDVGKDGNTRERDWHIFLVIRLEIEKLPLMADKCEAKRREVSSILVKSRRGQHGEFRLVVRAGMTAPLQAVQKLFQMGQFVHAETRVRGDASISPSVVL